MQVMVCGARGSVASPGARFNRFGGNTSCVRVTLSDGTHVVLDAGTGMRNVPAELADGAPVHILLTHLHLDHIQGLLFFSPLFRSDAQVTIWGPEEAGATLQDRIGRYLSAPLTPVDVRELPCRLDFRDCPVSEWTLGSARIRAAAVAHRGPTLGFRIEDAGATLCYIPDHEPAIIGPLDELEPEWLSGHSLARGADLLIHDAQYTDPEYPSHFGWGHSSISHAIHFAERCRARRLMLFHHDPFHDDEALDRIHAGAAATWQELGRRTDDLSMAIEEAGTEVVAAPRRSEV